MRGACPFQNGRLGSSTFRALCLSALCIALITPALAKPNKRSRAAYKNGVAHFKQKSYGRAIESFVRAYRYDKSPTILFNIARSFEELGEYHAALLYFRKCRLETPRNKRGDLDRTIARIEAMLRAQARGEPVDQTPTTRPKTAPTPAGVAKVMPAAPAAAEPAVSEDAPPPILDEDAPLPSFLENPPPDAPRTREVWVWATLGGGISLLAGAAFAGLEANEKSKALDAIEADPTQHTRREFTDLQNAGNAWSTASDVMLGSGLFAIGLASYFLFEAEIADFFTPARSGEVMGFGFTF